MWYGGVLSGDSCVRRESVGVRSECVRGGGESAGGVLVGRSCVRYGAWRRMPPDCCLPRVPGVMRYEVWRCEIGVWRRRLYLKSDGTGKSSDQMANLALPDGTFYSTLVVEN